MSFRDDGTQLKLNASNTPPHSALLSPPSTDTRIRSVLDKLKEQGGNPLDSGGDILDLRIQQVERMHIH